MLLLGRRRNVVFVGRHPELLDVIVHTSISFCSMPINFCFTVAVGHGNYCEGYKNIRLFMMIFVCCDLTFYGLQRTNMAHFSCILEEIWHILWIADSLFS